MLGFISRFGSSKGMVRMPDLSGLTRPQALAALENAGLRFSGSSTETTSSSSLSDKIKTQSIAANSLLEYESEASFIYYSYVPYVPTVTYGNCEQYSFDAFSWCSGTTRIRTETGYRRRAVNYDGVFQFYEECSSTSSYDETQNSTLCGYVPPAATCTASCGSYSSWSACKILYSMGGERTRTRTCTRTNCSTYTQTDSEPCCTPYCGAWSAWTTVFSGVQNRSRTCVRADCSSYTDTESRCGTQSSTTCGACSRKSPFRKTCTTTTVSSNCSTSSSSYSTAC